MRLSKKLIVSALVSVLSALVVVVTPAAAQATTSTTRTWTGNVNCFGSIANTGLTVNVGDRVQVSATGLCYFYSGRPSNYTPGEGLHSRIGASYGFTYGAPVSATAPVAGGLSFYFGDSLYNDNSGSGYTVTVTVTPASEMCREFTATSRYLRATVADLYRGIPLPSYLQQYLNRVVINKGLAYMQLKGLWCYKNGQVTHRSIRPVQSALTGAGLSGLVFSVQSTATGAISVENYGSGATRYRVSQTKAVVYLEVPVAVNLTIPGTDVGMTIPAGSKRPIYTMVMDTLLTGSGNVSCAATAAAPCSTTSSAEFTRH